MFLTEGALYLVVVDLLKYDQESCDHNNEVYQWLYSLWCRVPGCNVVIVATHIDCIQNEQLRTLKLNKLKQHVQEFLEKQQREIEIQHQQQRARLLLEFQGFWGMLRHLSVDITRCGAIILLLVFPLLEISLMLLLFV